MRAGSTKSPAVPAILADPIRDRGVAFTAAEREAVGLTGRLPSAVLTPGKVNPTQCEAMVMVCIQVLGQDTAIAFAGSQGNFELNGGMRPIIINNFLHEATILTGACGKLREYCIEGTELNRSQIDGFVGRSLMLVTALSPAIGYDKASAIAHKANDEGSTLREAALASGYISALEFDSIADPAKMVGDTRVAPAPTG